MAIKAFECSQMNSKFVWYCHQSTVNLAEHKRIEVVQVPGHMWTDGNETVDQLVSKAPHIHLKVPQPSLGTLTKAARGEIRGCMSRKYEHWQSIHGKRQAKIFLKAPSANRAMELLNLSRIS